MLPFFLLDSEIKISSFQNMKNIMNLLYLGFCASALCFVTWNYAVKALGTVNTSIYIYLVPVITIIFSVIFLNEKISPLLIVGTVLTISGLFLSDDYRMHKKAES